MDGLKGYKKLNYVRVGDLKSAQKKGQLEFTLPNQLEPIRAKAVRVEAKDASNFKWFGETELGESILLISQGDTVFGHIASSTKRYNLIGLGKKLSALAEIDPAAFPGADCATPKPIREVKGSTKSAGASGRMGPQQCINPIRILFLSTQAARTADPNIGQTIWTALYQFNGAVSSSRIDSRAALQHAGYIPIDLVETPNIETDVNTLATDRPDVEQLRVNLQADIVLLLTNNNYVGARGIVRQIEANRAGANAISKVGSAANDYTLAHEVGHLFGGIHENSTEVVRFSGTLNLRGLCDTVAQIGQGFGSPATSAVAPDCSTTQCNQRFQCGRLQRLKMPRPLTVRLLVGSKTTPQRHCRKDCRPGSCWA